jgi:hypothetical protein
MPVKEMSFLTAMKVFDLYAQRLIDLDKLELYEQYGYSDMDGFDVIDLANAMKLLMAYRVYTLRSDSEQEVAELTKYASEDDSALAGYELYFVPDETAALLKQIDPLQPDAMAESARICCAKKPHHLHDEIQKIETGSSFLRYCLNVGASHSNYWGKVYKRIGISWETHNDQDWIYKLIKNKVNYSPDVDG